MFTQQKPFGANSQGGSGFSFGSQNQGNTGFGSGGFGANNQQNTNAFGTQPQSNTGLFGSQTSANTSAFGQPQQQQGGSAFGSSQPAGSFGTQSNTGMFGQQQSNSGTTFGGQNQSAFGTQNNNTGLFGGSLNGGNNNTANKSVSFGFGTKPAAPAFGAPQQQGTSLFGNQNQTQPQQSGGLFGQNQQQQQQTGGFGQQGSAFGGSQQNTGFGAANTSANTFGQSNTGSLFGAAKPATGFGSQPSTGGSLFGQNSATNTQQNTGFGMQQQTNQGTGFGFSKPAGGLFGSQPQTQNTGLGANSTNQQTGSTFGQGFGSNNNTSQTGSLFGQNKPATTSTGLFGSQNAANTSTSGGLFGNQQNQQNQQQNTGGLFGSKPAGGSLFGSSLGSTANKPLFGSTTTQPAATGGFGLGQNTGSGGLFGSQNTGAGATGTSSFGGFGSTTNSNNTGTGLFGQSLQKPATTTSSTFQLGAAGGTGNSLFGSSNQAASGTAAGTSGLLSGQQTANGINNYRAGYISGPAIEQMMAHYGISPHMPARVPVFGAGCDPNYIDPQTRQPQMRLTATALTRVRDLPEHIQAYVEEVNKYIETQTQSSLKLSTTHSLQSEAAKKLADDVAVAKQCFTADQETQKFDDASVTKLRQRWHEIRDDAESCFEVFDGIWPRLTPLPRLLDVDQLSKKPKMLDAKIEERLVPYFKKNIEAYEKRAEALSRGVAEINERVVEPYARKSDLQTNSQMSVSAALNSEYNYFMKVGGKIAQVHGDVKRLKMRNSTAGNPVAGTLHNYKPNLDNILPPVV